MTDNDLSNHTLFVEIRDLATSIGVVVKQFQHLNHPLIDSKEKVPIVTEQLDRITAQTEAATHQMLDMVESILDREENMIKDLERIKKLAADGKTDDIGTLTDRVIDKAHTTLEDTYEMMSVMQFQDITAQQINRAAASLDEVEQRLTKIETIMSGDPNPGHREPANRQRPQRAFNPDANYADQQDVQAAVDDLISQQTARGK